MCRKQVAKLVLVAREIYTFASVVLMPLTRTKGNERKSVFWWGEFKPGWVKWVVA